MNKHFDDGLSPEGKVLNHYIPNKNLHPLK
jgi:hypothetical protein